MTLAFLSLQRVGHRKVPHVPTPSERMAAYNARRPVVFANTFFPQRMDARPLTPDPPDYRYFAEHSYSDLSQGY